jgi:hypothetical protein
MIDTPGPDAVRDKLASRHDPMLSTCKLRNPSIRHAKLLLALYFPVTCSFVRHGARVTPLIAYMTRRASRFRAERRGERSRAGRE